MITRTTQSGEVHMVKTAKDYLQSAMWRNYADRKKEGSLFSQRYDKFATPLKEVIKGLKSLAELYEQKSNGKN